VRCCDEYTPKTSHPAKERTLLAAKLARMWPLK